MRGKLTGLGSFGLGSLFGRGLSTVVIFAKLLCLALWGGHGRRSSSGIVVGFDLFALAFAFWGGCGGGSFGLLASDDVAFDRSFEIELLEGTIKSLATREDNSLDKSDQ